MSKKEKEIKMFPIGHVKSSNGEFLIKIEKEFSPALKQLENFSHMMVFWWADKNDTKKARSITQCRPPYAKDKVTGIFACRSEYRPNPIAITTTRILNIDEESGIIKIGWIDAFDGTPVVDIKAYVPVCDRVKEVQIPEWLSDWPEWMPEGDEDFDPTD